jgi:hypothetical protein
MEGIFMSETSKRAPDKSGMPFVDPWAKKPNHQGGVPVDAVFVGAWDNYVGIDSLYEALFLVRDDGQDLLWSLATHSEKSTKQNLAAREGGDPEWVKSKITSGCVGGAPREGTVNKAAMRLLPALVRARIPYEFPRPPYLPGLLTHRELAGIVRAVAEEFRRNSQAADAASSAPFSRASEVKKSWQPVFRSSCARLSTLFWIRSTPRERKCRISTMLRRRSSA